MVHFPNAKINLGLNVIERRPDGYHNLETVFYPVKPCDILEVIRADRFSFRQTGLEMEIPADENLVVKAYRMMKKQFDLPPVKIHLHKVIPAGAGLGGGSSDAAFMLKMVNELFGTGCTGEQLREMAGTLGADCPFFIDNTPSLATGIGNVLEPIMADLSAFHVVLVKPLLSVSTAMAYRAVSPRKPVESLPSILARGVETWKGRLVNDFEEPVCDIFPEIGEIRDTLYRLGALYASMSGSGSAVYGLFNELPDGVKEWFPEGTTVFL